MMPMFFDADRSLRQLRTQIGTMRTLSVLPEVELYATKAFSRWTPSEHVDHTARVALAMLKGSLRTDLPRLTPINLLGRVILTLGRIPRGLGRAPEKYRGARVPAETLLHTLSELDTVSATVDTAELTSRPIPCIPHPRFGGLTPEQTLRFIAIHNDHHLRIIRDILKK